MKSQTKIEFAALCCPQILRQAVPQTWNKLANVVSSLACNS